MNINQFGRVGDVAKALFGTYLVCLCIFMAFRAIEGVFLYFDRPTVVYKDYTDPETGCQLKAVYRDGKLTGFNPVFAEDNTIAGCGELPQ